MTSPEVIRWIARDLIGKSRREAEKILRDHGASEAEAAEIVALNLGSLTQTVVGNVDQIFDDMVTIMTQIR